MASQFHSTVLARPPSGVGDIPFPLAAFPVRIDVGRRRGLHARNRRLLPGRASARFGLLGDFFFDPKDVTADAGSVTISAPNVGQVEHELVLFKTDADPASLPVSGGDVDEEALEEQSAEEAGEIADVPPGQTKEKSFKLTAGKYVMFCNLPAHYKQGMYGSVTVK